MIPISYSAPFSRSRPGVVFPYKGKEKNSAKETPKQLAAGMQSNDPSAARKASGRAELSPVAPRRPQRLPAPVERKLYKTGQTRGASQSEIYQNRVGRNSTVLIPFSLREACQLPAGDEYENGSIVLIPPEAYFEDPAAVVRAGLELGENALVFYERRVDWVRWPPAAQGWRPAKSRLAPLGGKFVARLAGTTAAPKVSSVRQGFTTTASRGAGIRVYEYADTAIIALVRLQLEALIWMCSDAAETFEIGGMTAAAVSARRDFVLCGARKAGLLDLDRHRQSRAIGRDDRTVCPLCLEQMSARLFSDRIQQAAGRARFGSTITEASLFHLSELRVGRLGHKPYNVGWGHHHCNVVAKDAGILETIAWMRQVVDRNDHPGP